MDANFNWTNGEFEPIFTPYAGLLLDIESTQKLLNSPISERKAKISAQIDGLHQVALCEAKPYLEYNAQDRGDLIELRYAENLPNVCGKQVAWFGGENTGNEYFKKISCRKQWCPICGGKKGTIHKARLHSLLSRINPRLYNIRQFVFTIPDTLREKFHDRESLNLLFKLVRQVIEKRFGYPVLDKYGHIKKYKLDKPVVAYLHLFGDNEIGTLKPHINIHILEEKNVVLKLSADVLEGIKRDWLKKLQKLDNYLTVADVHYNFDTKKGKIIHKLKYMSRPWSQENYAAVDDESIKRLLVLDLVGFQYMRYWGKLSNPTYKDEMDIKEITQECETQINEKLVYKGISLIDFESYASKNRLLIISEGFYQVLKKGLNYEKQEVGAGGVLS